MCCRLGVSMETTLHCGFRHCDATNLLCQASAGTSAMNCCTSTVYLSKYLCIYKHCTCILLYIMNTHLCLQSFLHRKYIVHTVCLLHIAIYYKPNTTAIHTSTYYIIAINYPMVILLVSLYLYFKRHKRTHSISQYSVKHCAFITMG